jgi:chemotaxis protein methyltransferase CheR
MTAMESLNQNSKFDLVASDIDSKVLALAESGIYKIDGLKGISEARVQRFFLRGKGSNEGMVRVKPELQNAIQFLSVNLIRDDWPFRDPFNVVFCRNVMIYFDAPTQRKVLERIHRVMISGGLLFVGHAENFSESRDLFVLKGKTVYERI